MTPAISDQLGVLAQQREELDVERRRIQKAYCLAVLDHIAAQVFALPDLAGRHLVPVCGDYTHPYGSTPSDLVRLMPLPPAA